MNITAPASQVQAPAESVTTVRDGHMADAGTKAYGVVAPVPATQPSDLPALPSRRDAQRPIVLTSPVLAVADLTVASWHCGEDSGDDWDEIAAQESFLAADESLPGWEEPDDPPDEEWPGGSVTTLH